MTNDPNDPHEREQESEPLWKKLPDRKYKLANEYLGRLKRVQEITGNKVDYARFITRAFVEGYEIRNR